MEATTPDTSSPKRGRAKPKTASATPVETKSTAVKKPRAPRKSPTAKATGQATRDPMSEDVGTMIATAAYYLAAARNFSPGHELDDWLEAERTVHARLYG